MKHCPHLKSNRFDETRLFFILFLEVDYRNMIFVWANFTFSSCSFRVSGTAPLILVCYKNTHPSLIKSYLNSKRTLPGIDGSQAFPSPKITSLIGPVLKGTENTYE